MGGKGSGGHAAGAAALSKSRPTTTKIPKKSIGLALELAAWIMTLPHIVRTDVPALEQRFIDYVKFCHTHKIKLGNLAAYAALGLEKNTIWEWASGYSGTPEQCTLAKNIKQIMGMARETYAQNGDLNPIIAIFYGKNFDGLSDQQELVVKTTNPFEDIATMEELKSRYALDVDDHSG